MLLIGQGGESAIVSHFVQSIFSDSWVEMGEKQCTLDASKYYRGLQLGVLWQNPYACLAEYVLDEK
jgi:hypothetical protein